MANPIKLPRGIKANAGVLDSGKVVWTTDSNEILVGTGVGNVVFSSKNGVPAGGASGQVLTKTGSADFQTGWRTPASGGGGEADLGGVAVEYELVEGRDYEIIDLEVKHYDSTGTLLFYGMSIGLYYTSPLYQLIIDNPDATISVDMFAYLLLVGSRIEAQLALSSLRVLPAPYSQYQGSIRLPVIPSSSSTVDIPIFADLGGQMVLTLYQYTAACLRVSSDNPNLDPDIDEQLLQIGFISPFRPIQPSSAQPLPLNNVGNSLTIQHVRVRLPSTKEVSDE